jgi:UDPglucose 6-dehydrogenase
LRVVPALVAAGAQVVVHDPIALDNARASLGDVQIKYEADLARSLAGADAVLLVTAWPDYAEVPKLLEGRDLPVIDGRRMLPSDSLPGYDGVGYPTR